VVGRICGPLNCREEAITKIGASVEQYRAHTNRNRTILTQPFDISPTAVPWAFLVSIGAALWIVNAIWLAIDTQPPVWDMALHQTYALHYVPGYPAPAGLRFWELSGNYPPLVHLFMALAFGLGRPGPDTAAFANLPATLLLLWSLYKLSCYFAGPRAARWACGLLLLVPYLIWMSRETILDYWLTAWVVSAWLVLVKTNGFESVKQTRLFGVLCGLGLLTKWLFAGFMVIPVLVLAARHRIWRDARRIRNAAEAVFLTALVAGGWYIPNLRRLAEYFPQNAQIGALEGEPRTLSFQSAIYYLRLLEGYQLYGVLFLLMAAGIVVTFRRGLFRDATLWVAMIGGAWLLLTLLLRTKDPRFSMPLLPLLLLPAGALLAGWTSRHGRYAQVAVLALLLFQAYVINFGVSWLPPQAKLMNGYQGSLRWDWQLYSQHYFGILGAPRRENWQQHEIIRRVAAESRSPRPAVTLIPDLARFDMYNFQLFADLDKIPMSFGHTGAGPAHLDSFNGFDFVIITNSDQGMSWTTPEASSLTRFVKTNPSTFHLLATYDLPNHDTAGLYAVAAR
jgi:hypothetical protein